MPFLPPNQQRQSTEGKFQSKNLNLNSNVRRVTATQPRDLVLAGVLHHFLVDDLVHHLEPLDGFLLRDADILLFQWNRPEGVVEEEQASVDVDSEEPGNVAVVGKGRR